MTRSDSYWGLRARTNRRRVLRAGALGSAGVAGFALAGCGDDDDDNGGSAATTAAGSGTSAATRAATPAAAAQPKKGGIFVVDGAGGPLYPAPYDPHTYPTIGYMVPTHSRLMSIDIGPDNASDWKALPDAAATWEQPDPLTLIFHLA